MSKTDILRLDEYLGHIVQAIDRVHRYVDDMVELTFLQDEKTQDAVIRNFEVIGEASNNIKKYHPDFVNQHPEVPLNFENHSRRPARATQPSCGTDYPMSNFAFLQHRAFSGEL